MPATVLATYDGFTKTPNTYAYYTETDDNDIAIPATTGSSAWPVSGTKTPAASGIQTAL